MRIPRVLEEGHSLLEAVKNIEILLNYLFFTFTFIFILTFILCYSLYFIIILVEKLS